MVLLPTDPRVLLNATSKAAPLTQEEHTRAVADIQTTPIVLVARSTERVADMEPKLNPGKDTRRALMSTVVADVLMMGVPMDEVTAEGVMNNKVTVMSPMGMAARKNRILKATVPAAGRMKGTLGAGRMRGKPPPPMGEAMEGKHTVVDILKATVVETKARAMVGNNTMMTIIAILEGVRVKSHTAVVSHTSPDAMTPKGMATSTNEMMTLPSRMVDKNMVAQRDIPAATTMMIAIARVTLPRTVKLRTRDMVHALTATATMAIATGVVDERRKIARASEPVRKAMVVVTKALVSAQKATSEAVMVPVAAPAIPLAMAATKPTVQNASIFAAMTMTRTITAGRSTTAARTQTILKCITN